jgi:hypothetical protein
MPQVAEAMQVRQATHDSTRQRRAEISHHRSWNGEQAAGCRLKAYQPTVASRFLLRPKKALVTPLQFARCRETTSNLGIFWWKK